MAVTPERLGFALERLQTLQGGGRRVFRSRELSRTTRDRLVAAGYLASPMRGWLIASSPFEPDPGESTPWYSSFWEFCAAYASERFDRDWHLSAEQSLLLLAENWTIPPQVIICSAQASNNLVDLPHETSLFDLRIARQDPVARIAVSASGPDLNLLDAEHALVRVPEAFFKRFPAEAAAILHTTRDVTPLLRLLLEGGQSHVAGRLIGALRHVGRDREADAMLSSLRVALMDIRETDPFESARAASAVSAPPASPIAHRVRALWTASRSEVLERFPSHPQAFSDRSGAGTRARVVSAMEARYAADAYHSLSIEGYQITHDLVERVRSGRWNPDAEDRGTRDALAAKGYWLAFQAVKASILRALADESVAQVVREEHAEWHRQLFGPSVAAGIVAPGHLAGYRNTHVFIRGSRHVPPRSVAVPDGMDALFDCIAGETHPGVRAVLAHWLFGYLHPYSDGNGRMARFMMNALLVTAGYPWTVIRVEDRAAYMAALELASLGRGLGDFTELIVRSMAE